MRRACLLFIFVGLGFVGLLRISAEAEPVSQRGIINADLPFVEIPLRLEQDGQTLTAFMRATSGDLDPLLLLVDQNGVIVAENDDLSADDSSSRLVYPLAAAGSYTLVATRYGLRSGISEGAYEVIIERNAGSSQNLLPIYDVSAEALAEAGYPLMGARPRADWTIIAYFGGDTNLEPGVMNDFNEFEMAGGSNEQVRIVALLDRHPEFTTASGNWQTGRLFEIGPDISQDEAMTYPPTLDTPELADLGQINTGSGETLARFLVWALQTYPAERYAIVLASHGGGWQGVISDDSDGGSLITLPELRAAFEAARQVAQVERFDLLINDACSMGSIEYAISVAPYFQTSLASAEIVVNPALDMRLLAEMLNEEPQISLKTLGQALIDAYMDRDIARREGLDKDYLNFALTDLSKIDALEAALERFSTAISEDLYRNGLQLGAARANSYVYSAFLGAGSRVDVGSLMSRLREQSSNPSIPEAIDDVMTALQDSLLYAKAAPLIEDVISHYSLYFPPSSRDFDSAYLEANPLASWSGLLRDYFVVSAPRLWSVDDSAQAFHPPSAPQVRVTRVYPQTSSNLFPPSISVEVVGRNIASGSFTIDQLRQDGSIVRLAQAALLTETNLNGIVTFSNRWRAGVDQSTFYWMPFTLPVVSDGTTSSVEYLKRRGDVAALEGRYRESAEAQWNDVSVLFSASGKLQGTIGRQANSSLASIVIPEGAEFQTYIPVVGSDGSTKPTPHTLYTWDAAQMSWSNQPTPNGQYRLGFLVEAFGGAVGFDAATVKVDNRVTLQDELGFIDIGLGINFTYPADWSSVVDYGNWLNTTSPDGQQAINIYHFPAQENIFDILREVKTRYGLEQLGPAQTMNWFESGGLMFDHRYSNSNGQNWRGRAIVLWRQTLSGNRALVFSVDARDEEGVPDPATLFRPRLETLRYINSNALISTDTSQWRYTLLDSLIPLPLRRDWSRGELDGWTVFRPTRGEVMLQTAQVRRLEGQDIDQALDSLIETFAQDATLIQRRNYIGAYYDWEAASYQITRRVRNPLGRMVDMAFYGRLYVTRINNELYGWRFEAPDDEQASALYRQVFEPMLEGFAPPESLSFTGGTRDNFLRAALTAKAGICANVGWNQACLASGTLRVLERGNRTRDIRRAGSLIDLSDVQGLQVGVGQDGSIDPQAMIVLKLQANIPDRNSQEAILLTAFGGANLINGALLDEGQSYRVFVYNESGQRLAIRQRPDPSAPMVGSLAQDQQAGGIGLSADRRWIRVQLPLKEDQTGWISREFVQPSLLSESFDKLPLSDPEQPHFGPMQRMEFYAQEADTGGILDGLFIQTTTNQLSVTLEINGRLFQVNPNALFLWDRASEALVSVGAKDNIFEFGGTRRKPEGFGQTRFSSVVRVQSRGEREGGMLVGNLFERRQGGQAVAMTPYPDMNRDR